MVSTILVSLKQKRSIREADREAQRVKRQLKEKGFESRYLAGTNVILVPIKGDRFAISKGVNAMHKISDIWFQIIPDSNEVRDALQNHEYFKAFTLCVTLYESYGKAILINEFKDKADLAKDLLDRFNLTNIIEMLFKHQLIEEQTRCYMISVKDTRNYFVHQYLSITDSKQVDKKIRDNSPKIIKSLEDLKIIYDKLPRK